MRFTQTCTVGHLMHVQRVLDAKGQGQH